MRQTLFYIPHAILGLPVFGFGWLLIAWLLFAAVLLGRLVSRRGFDRETRSHIPLLLLVAAVIAFLLPRMEVVSPDGAPLGLPIRGFGAMLLLALLAGLALTVHLARRAGIERDVVYAMSFWMCVGGIVGARSLYVIEYWHLFRRPTLTATLWEVVKFTEGGIIIYGCFAGAMIAFLLFTAARRLPRLLLADVAAPGMMLGMAIGRIGCLLNGCCYGGLATDGALAITFPRYSSPELSVVSPPYLHQWESGQLHGMQIAEERSVLVIREVERGSKAERAGLKPGMRIAAVCGARVASVADARRAIASSGPEIEVTTDEGATYRWTIGRLPECSLPVHPTQLYSSVNAALLCLLLFSFFPLRTRDGQVFAVMLTLYPITRFLLEILRDDEPGQLGTPLTISQILSLIAVACAAGLWLYVARQAPHARQPLGRR